MALNASVSCVNVAEARRIHDICLRWLLHVIAARAVTLLAADIPLGHFLRAHIVIDGMASIAGGSGRALHVVFGIILGPPVCPRLNIVGAPDFMGHVPLGWQREVIVADSLKVPLLPFAPVYEGD